MDDGLKDFIQELRDYGNARRGELTVLLLEAANRLEQAERDIKCLRDQIKGMKKSEWISIKYRHMTPAERAEYKDVPEGSLVLSSRMPDDGDEVLVSLSNGFVEIDTFHDDNGDCYFENNDDMDDVKAWMRLPSAWED